MQQFRKQSLQRKLPLFIFVLLLLMVMSFGGLSYIGIKQTAEDAAKERLQILAQQLSGMYAQSAVPLLNNTKAAATNPAVVAFLRSAGADSVNAVEHLLEKLQPDTTWFYIQLLDKNRLPFAGIHNPLVNDTLQPETLIPGYPNTNDTGRVSKLYIKDEAFYYALCAAITDNKQHIGYLVRWRKMYNSKENIERVSQLLGKNVVMYVGNTDGGLWSDLRKQVNGLPATKEEDEAMFTYQRNQQTFLAAQSLVRNADWKVLVTVPQENVLLPAKQFLQKASGIAVLVLLVGLLLTWLLSRSITGPINKLAKAAGAIAKGDFSQTAELKRHDELGVLAKAFNQMAKEVKDTQENLEANVAKRTAQLERANKELEAFSYSVSHDLRSPLRAVSGYAMILKDDYQSQLNEEGNRLIDTIIKNARMMGQLIDDLISFSRIGRKDADLQQVNMQQLVEQVITELKVQRPGKKYHFVLHKLPSCTTDPQLIKQVWVNLIDNAMKYSSLQEEPVIEIGATMKNGKTEYYVKDNGVGFDMHYSHKLFGVFQRLHRQDEFEGTGIGLALVKRIIERQNGTIHAESSIGNGAVFAFSLT